MRAPCTALGARRGSRVGWGKRLSDFAAAALSAPPDAPLTSASPRLPTLHKSRKAIFAAAVGNVLEWYDFGVYVFFASVIARNFFPSGNPAAALLSSFAVFGVGFLMRPHSTYSRQTAAYSTSDVSMPTKPTVNPPEREGRSYIRSRTKQMANAEENIQRVTAIETLRLM